MGGIKDTPQHFSWFRRRPQHDGATTATVMHISRKVTLRSGLNYPPTMLLPCILPAFAHHMAKAHHFITCGFHLQAQHHIISLVLARNATVV
jgi:hypothetical protein